MPGGIDYSMYQNMQGPDIVGGLEKGMKLSDMMTQRKDAEAKKAAYKQGVITNADGTTSFDPSKTVSALAGIGDGREAMDVQEKSDAQKAAKSQRSWEDYQHFGQLAKNAQNQKDWEGAIDAVAKRGGDVSGIEKTFDPKYRDQVANSLLTKAQQMEFDIKNREIGAKHAEIAESRKTREGAKSNQEMQQTLSLIEQARGNPAVQQAERDLYAGKKANRLYESVSDPNKMSPQMFNLYKAEIGKMAQGGSPTVEELKGLDPKTFSGELASAWQRVSGDPTPANLGAFAKQYKAYTDSIQEDARAMIGDRYGRLIESKKRALSPEDYQTLQTQYMGRFDHEQKPPQQAEQPPPANPKDGDSYAHGGVTYKVVNGFWVPQTNVASGGR